MKQWLTKQWDYALSFLFLGFTWVISWPQWGCTVPELSSDSLLLGCAGCAQPCPYPAHPACEQECEFCSSPNLSGLTRPAPAAQQDRFDTEAQWGLGLWQGSGDIKQLKATEHKTRAWTMPEPSAHLYRLPGGAQTRTTAGRARHWYHSWFLTCRWVGEATWLWERSILFLVLYLLKTPPVAVYVHVYSKPLLRDVWNTGLVLVFLVWSIHWFDWAYFAPFNQSSEYLLQW